MGVSTDAILFYGFPFDEDFDLDEHDFGPGVEDWYGTGDRWDEEHGPEKPKDEDYQSAEWDNWREAKKQYEASTAHVEIDQHCSGEYPMHFVCCGKIRAWRGYPAETDPRQMQVDLAARRESLKAFCERFKLPFKEPGWHLVSYWG